MNDKHSRRCIIIYSLPATELYRQEQIRTLADRLNSEGVDTEIDLYHPAPPEGWPQWMEEMMKDRTVLLICTKQYYERFERLDSSGEGGVAYEARLVRLRLLNGKGINADIFPLLLSPADREFIPGVLRDVTPFDISQEADYEKLYAVLTDRKIHEKPSLGEIRSLRAPNQVIAAESSISTLNPDDAATHQQIGAALERLLDGLRRLFIKGIFPFDAWQDLHRELDSLVRGHAGARALGSRYAPFCKAMDHDQFCINYCWGLHQEFEKKSQAFKGLSKEYEKREIRYHDAYVVQAVSDDVLTLAPFLRDFGNSQLAERLEFVATAQRAIAERTLQEPPI